MDVNTIHYLEYEGVHIAAFIESRDQNAHSEYLPLNILYYVQQGQLNIVSGEKTFVIPEGNCCLVKKYSELTYYKTWSDGQDSAVVFAMGLKDDFIQEAVKEMGYKFPKQHILDPVVGLGQNVVLKGLFNSLKLYVEEYQEADKALMYLKTKEALIGIIQTNPKYLSLFYEVSRPVKADLRLFMDHHSLSGATLEELARLSGRSLSTFYRDFKKLFHTSPHKWLLQSRLSKAKDLLLHSSKKSSEIYLDLGFKDLGHFSRTFKQEFGVPPSEVASLKE